MSSLKEREPSSVRGAFSKIRHEFGTVQDQTLLQRWFSEKETDAAVLQQGRANRQRLRRVALGGAFALAAGFAALPPQVAAPVLVPPVAAFTMAAARRYRRIRPVSKLISSAARVQTAEKGWGDSSELERADARFFKAYLDFCHDVHPAVALPAHLEDVEERVLNRLNHRLPLRSCSCT